MKLAAARHGHAAAYHGVRAPALPVHDRVVGAGRDRPRGGRAARLVARAGHARLERQAAADGLLSDHLRIHKAAREIRTARGLILAVRLAVVVAALVILAEARRRGRGSCSPPSRCRCSPAPGARRASRSSPPPPSRRRCRRRTRTSSPARSASWASPGSTAWLRDGRPLVFPSPVREDGPGWRAEVDLPFGVTAAMVTERREQLASGLRRPLGAVWPEPVTHEHAGQARAVGRPRGRQQGPPAPWPLLRGGQADVFGEPCRSAPTSAAGSSRCRSSTTTGCSVRIPRQGKTAAVRVLACGVALDPLAEMWVHELKGSGDLDPLERVSPPVRLRRR